MKQRKPTFLPIAQLPNLMGSLADTIQAQIEEGHLLPGQRLPTEQSIVESTGVSRTVVREALATLRARGLIATRQGIGAFVAEPVVVPPSFMIPQPTVESGLLTDLLRVLELRLAIEVEAAALAAERRSDEDLVQLELHLEALGRPEGTLEHKAEHDFSFHRALLTATRNEYFVDVINVLGNFMFARQKRVLDDMAASTSQRYLQRLVGEHRTILDAVRVQDVGAAKRAMRAHLGKAYARYQKFDDTSSTAGPSSLM